MSGHEKAIDVAKNIKLLVLDVDGVLTDGGIYFDENGIEHKKFDSQDGVGIKLLQLSEIEVAVITARSTKSVAHRLKGLGVKHYYHGVLDKSIALKELTKELSIDMGESAYVGDDVIDLPAMTRVGLPVAVANAHSFVKENALMITNSSGGSGAVREVCDFLLKSQNKYDELMASFLK
ncbi:MAG: HAD-IIIA family hydrolase [Thiotrichales bacterium]|jgi:3-deoxy-D-manno-octulosonate 8-phosphate phosphatase (KDO 8-P phosphatase)|nr:HAD-IIIA family hydrolase [Thiotrichales bacterium]